MHIYLTRSFCFRDEVDEGSGREFVRKERPQKRREGIRLMWTHGEKFAQDGTRGVHMTRWTYVLKSVGLKEAFS